ncbi:hypothetical protein [endosymbiont GvMRE of Glomus versiforme]|uniref:hypothetical protein n=1 Tax=endosymbiont GvMRE of Glomus versiforme TaxID=2039283 RepID=UPI000EE10E3E|nr:hypothetical protein [endosymbiont GvMRE of Glomus versiforme]RHZ37745.1 hypothetical protein GvMRE_I1g538 [endosymbiont GvMRE of Glomus versiforme]
MTSNSINGNIGMVIAELTEKVTKKDKNGETYYLLKLSIRKRLTEMYFELRNEKQPIPLPNSDDPLFVFTNKNRNRFAFTLTENCIYLFKYSKSRQNDNDYLHVEDWRKLGDDKRVIERSYRALLDKKNDFEDEEDELTNKELLLELKKRIKDKRVKFLFGGADGEVAKVLEEYEHRIDTDLKDNESGYCLNLQESEEKEVKHE